MKKHRVRFEVAATVFDDPNEFTEEDLDAVAERRWRTVGRSNVGSHLFVIHTERDMIGSEVVVRIISARQALPVRRKDMNDKPRFVEYTPRPLTEAEKAEAMALSDRPDSEIDLSDMPELTEEFWEKAIRNPYLYPPVRMSADVVEYFQQRVGDHGSIMMAINHVLLDYIAAEKKKAAKKAG